MFLPDGKDLITPHLPQAASSPQAPQGEDNEVRRKFCTNIAQSHGVRGNYGFLRTFDTGLPEIYVSVADLMRL